MSATLVIEVDQDVLDSAEKSAKARNTTVNEVVADQLKWMAENWRQSQAGKTPITDSLRGIAHAGAAGSQDLLADQLMKKHGLKA